ncbi:hypothetical protein [Streptomyces sp. AM6-12]|uniref:hypothetical protein n=1 Tax=Streptomyces sp. AM6-12 TaxID=3345149 RepID=UPI0037A16938
MPEVVSPEKSKADRFEKVCGFRSTRATELLSVLFLFAAFEQEEGLPVGSYKSSAFETGSMGAVEASAVRLVHPLPELIDNSVDGGARRVGFPCGGTVSKIVARRAGARGVIRAERALSTGRLVQARRMDHEARVLPAAGGVRFGVYTCPMTKMTSVLAASAPRVSAVGR